ncbi:MAG: hypothetical protein DCE90_14050 [Pseudanabaena sp.]|nr:MAG: hypothetical protein DCE90_14050 [Pseudanabaena sp.]
MTEFSIQTINDATLVCDSREIATHLGIEHKNLLETIRNHQVSIESSFGSITFETESTQGRVNNPKPPKFALLTEDQFIFIATLSRNTTKVVQVKAKLVKAFIKAREILASTRHHSSLQLQLETPITSNDDELIRGYMNSHIESAKLVKSFDDALNLQINLVNFLDEYKAIQDQAKALDDRRAKLSKKNTFSSSPVSPDLKPALPSVNKNSLSPEELETLSEFIRGYASLLASNKSMRFTTKKPKGKTPFSVLLSEFENECRLKEVQYTKTAIENCLEAIGWTQDFKQADRWGYFF